MNKDYRGTIVEESLEDNRVLNGLEITSFRISSAENPADRWHLYSVKVSEDDILRLSRNIKAGKWYMHFWKGRSIKAVFNGKVFEFDYDDKSTWKDAVAYGRSVGIPEEQLDFVVM
jgi:hypothetical protein